MFWPEDDANARNKDRPLGPAPMMAIRVTGDEEDDIVVAAVVVVKQNVEGALNCFFAYNQILSQSNRIQGHGKMNKR